MWFKFEINKKLSVFFKLKNPLISISVLLLQKLIYDWKHKRFNNIISQVNFDCYGTLFKKIKILIFW